jgi:putative ABC transport system permease protein
VNPSLLLRTVLLRFSRFKLRTLSMGLGIAISVLATVLMQTVLVSVDNAFNSFIDRAYPSDGVVIMAGSGFMGGASGGGASLRLSDVETVVSSLGVKEWDPVVYIGPRDVKRGANTVLVNVAGSSEKAERVRRRSVEDGEFLSADDVKNRANVAAIGSSTAKTLFPGESPVGAQIFIDNVPFVVKGVLETVGVDPHGGDQDNTIWVPYTTVLDKMVKGDALSGATLIIDDPGRAEEVKKEASDVLRERHQITQGEPDDFTVITPSFVHNMHAKTARTWTVFVPLIAGTAFLISAVVILSIMQISIKGRTAEIGLRKAVGARPRDLQVQIVLEVLLVALAASAVGILLAQVGGYFLTPMLAAKFGVHRVTQPVTALLVAVSAAVLTGILGGLWPARRAAKLNQVEALK